MNDQVEQIKQKNDIVEIVGQSVKLTRAGRHYKGLCPFHSEKSPSFIVSPERQSYKCFGCGEGGDVISYLQKYEGMSFLESLEFLAKRAGIVLESYRPSTQDLVKKRQIEIMNFAALYYQYILKEHVIGKEAREYLQKRSITNEARDHFNLGYAPNSWRALSDYLTKKKGYTLEELVQTGMVIRGERGYYDRFRGRVMFPLRDHKGVVVGFSGRTIINDDKEAKYINSPETAIYSKGKMLYGLYENREYIRKAERVVIVEGELDMIPSWQVGVKEVVAIKGSAFTDDQARLITRYAKNVVFALDADSAGQEAIKRAVKVADPWDLSIRVVQITGGKDPGDVASQEPKKWREMSRQSSLFYDYLIDSSCQKFDPLSGDGAKKIAGDVIPTISQISNLIVKDLAVKKLSDVLGIKEEILYQEITRVEKKQTIKILEDKVKVMEKTPTSRREKLEEYLLSIIMQFPEFMANERDEDWQDILTTPSIAKIVSRLAVKDPKTTVAEFIRNLPSELVPVADEAYLRDLAELVTKEQQKKAYEQTYQELSMLELREQMKQLTPQIAQAEKEQDKDKLKELSEKFVSLSQKLNSAIIPD